MNLKKKILSYFKTDKERSMHAIDISIEDWTNFKKKNILLKVFLKKKSIHWKVNNIFSGYCDLYFVWGNKTIRTMTNVENEKIFDALNAIKKFYSKISTIKPDLSNPDILNCYNSTAKRNKFKEKKVILKEKVEVEVLDPFKNFIGKEMKLIQEKLLEQKKKELEYLKYSLFILDQFANKKANYSDLKKPKNLFFNKKNKTFYAKILWCGVELKSTKDKNIKNIKALLQNYEKLIKLLSISRPNLNDPIIKKIFDITLFEIREKNKFKLLNNLKYFLKKKI